MTRLLFVASEASPFVKTGGLADVIGSLPQALNKRNDVEVRVVLPLYQEILNKWKDKIEEWLTFSVDVGWRHHQVKVYQLLHQHTHFYFIHNDYYFSRHQIYGYEDDGERFIFFCQAVCSMLSKLEGFPVDILHAHDWQAALSIAFSKIYYPDWQLKTVYTIHNLKYQGIMQKYAFSDLFYLAPDHIGGFEWNGLLNCMKAGLFHAHKITTVSPTYAEEIKTHYHGEGLHSIINERHQDVSGILNGIDTEGYNPMTDRSLVSPFDHAGANKQANKKVLQQQLGLPVNEDTPLYVMVSRLVEQKGFHLVQRIIDEFLTEDVQFIILGSGEHEFEDYFYHAASRNPTKLVTYLGFSESLARQIYASSDFFVMPSLFEPCGLSQLIALQYKSVPIVRETGGLKDTVQAFNEHSLSGNGFSFQNYNAHDLLHVLRYALQIYHNETKWKALLHNVDKSSFDWQQSAEAYVHLYRALIHAKKGE
ncbi:glycogen synthase [Gracilibacillus caseinilyticus]|uniref:Glycogen synthase n=1 Tax=Gracilibacillus caseinilyticus TaxID=2932256 RepID=A0ABY4ES49_9BACI|nr:glycogen synthase [Gracilibacillus caseinilyticus]UOQ47260.1 glycogen synthase [Gracilibacillus caseinilyticus]